MTPSANERGELRPLVRLLCIVGSINDDLHVDPARDRGGERITDLRVAEVTDPQPNFGSRRIDRLDDRGPAGLRLDEERRGLIERTRPARARTSPVGEAGKSAERS